MSSGWTPRPDDDPRWGPVSPPAQDWTGPDWKGRDLDLPDEGPGSLARVGPRFVGLLVDALLFVPLVVLGVALSHPHVVTQVSTTGLRTRHLVTDHRSVALSLALLVPEAIYTVGLIAWRGQTVGQQAMGLRVLRRSDRQVPGLTSSLARWSVLGLVGVAVVFVPAADHWTWIWTLLVLLWAVWDRDRQGLHDKFAQVIVVRTR
jgi:uncharacterized RDD family membrane protein YckC